MGGANGKDGEEDGGGEGGVLALGCQVEIWLEGAGGNFMEVIYLFLNKFFIFYFYLFIYSLSVFWLFLFIFR